MTELDEPELQRLIREIPQPMREELMLSIRRLEAALELTGATYINWLEALRRYRATRAGGQPGPAKAGLLQPIVLDVAKEVDQAFNRLRRLPELKASIESMLQAGKSEAAAEARRVKKERQDAHRMSLVRQAWARAMGLSKRDPDAIKDSEVLQHFSNVWTDDQAKRLPKNEQCAAPARNTLKPLIDAVRDEIKNTRQSSG